ncbi:hypothetical protein EFQ99_13490 [Rhizobium vallis]|uniref:Uncharacterized protein n=1 Tax=Rhizobium vallis TaxID=634290 RepID=A0A432PL11_9HYPH|nr:hypothetical protein EFQ99_13490 [Rhizobium vallis]
MKEVRSVLHAIFRCLLKRLDERELGRRGGPGQGKTCRLIHISNFADRFHRALWKTGNSLTSLEQVHSLSTSRKKMTRPEETGIIFGFGFSSNSAWKERIFSPIFVHARQMASAVDGF